METHSPIARFLVVLASFIIVVAGMKAAESLLVPFLLSLFIAVICSPPLIWFKQKGLPSWLALITIISTIVIASILIGAVVGSSISEFRKDLPEYQERLTLLTSGLFDRLNAAGLNIDVSQIREGFNPSAALSMAGNTLASFGNMMGNAFLILLTTMFILGEEVGFSEKFAYARNSQKTLDAIRKFTQSVNRYMVSSSWSGYGSSAWIILCFGGCLPFYLTLFPPLVRFWRRFPPCCWL
jgi:AI-2 transport protein TqsA